jgi:hypothetical protein
MRALHLGYNHLNWCFHKQASVKILKSSPISSFGGMNFVLEHLNDLKIGDLCNMMLPSLPHQSKYSWKDILYSFSSIYYCGGDCIEDIGTHLQDHFINNPYFKMPSPDTVLRRFSSLSTEVQTCRTKRGKVDHMFCINDSMAHLNLKILKHMGLFRSKELILDYDNSILYAEKKDCKMHYKRDYGYQPGVCTLNEDYVLYIENRNGNSDAKSFQDQTLSRLFQLLEAEQTPRVNHFRADAASYQYDVVSLLEKNVDYFYIGCKNSYIEKFIPQVKKWQKIEDEIGSLEIGSVECNIFTDHADDICYRIVFKRRPKEDGQLDMMTQDAYEYKAILTNNYEWDAETVAYFYNRRGNMERQFDILKNDFGWNNMPFSYLNENLVFLYFSAICRNLYNPLIKHFSQKVKGLKPNFRIKKFIFRFIIMPAKWIKQAGQLKLRIYSYHSYFT